MRNRQQLWLQPCVVACLLSPVAPASAIVGPATEVPNNVSLVMVLSRQGNTAGFCTGIVVAQDVVMTAAHCVPKGGDLRVHYPSSAADPIMLPVTEVAIHPDYRANAIKTRERSIDLALIRLTTPLPQSFKPVTIARHGSTSVGARFSFMGFGVSHEGEARTSGVLRSTALFTRAPLSDILLWSAPANSAESGACTGDSGGPVFAQGESEVSGLILWSAGAHGRQCGALTQSLWLSPQHAWIDHVLEGWGHIQPT